MKNSDQNSYKCRRCNKPASADLMCQNCKNELLSNYEASADWQTAFEIEMAQLTALRYSFENSEEDDNQFY